MHVLAPFGDESDVCVPVYFANIWESVQFHMIKNLPVLLCVHFISIHTSIRQNIFQLGFFGSFWTNFDDWTTIGTIKNDDSRSSTTPMLFSENPRWPPVWEQIFDFLRA